MTGLHWIGGAAIGAVILIAAVLPQWLGIVVQLCGFGGALMLARPFFRENRYKKLRDRLQDVHAGGGGAQEAKKRAQAHIEAQLRSWRIEDYRDACLGILLLALSFGAGFLSELIKLFEARAPG